MKKINLLKLLPFLLLTQSVSFSLLGSSSNNSAKQGIINNLLKRKINVGLSYKESSGTYTRDEYFFTGAITFSKIKKMKNKSGNDYERIVIYTEPGVVRDTLVECCEIFINILTVVGLCEKLSKKITYLCEKKCIDLSSIKNDNMTLAEYLANNGIELCTHPLFLYLTEDMQKLEKQELEKQEIKKKKEESEKIIEEIREEAKKMDKEIVENQLKEIKRLNQELTEEKRLNQERLNQELKEIKRLNQELTEEKQKLKLKQAKKKEQYTIIGIIIIIIFGSLALIKSVLKNSYSSDSDEDYNYNSVL